MKYTWGPASRAALAEDAGLLGAAAHRHEEGRADRLEVGLDVADRAVQREDGDDVDPRGLLELREAAHRFGEAAGPGEGEIFGCHVDHRDRLARSGG